MDAVLAVIALAAAGIVAALYLRHVDRATRTTPPRESAGIATDGSDADSATREEAE